MESQQGEKENLWDNNSNVLLTFLIYAILCGVTSMRYRYFYNLIITN